MNKTDVLVYTGGAKSWEITEAQWSAAGFKQDTTRWNFTNSHRIVLGDIDPEALNYLLEHHGSQFRIMKSADVKRMDQGVTSSSEKKGDSA